MQECQAIYHQSWTGTAGRQLQQSRFRKDQTCKSMVSVPGEVVVGESGGARPWGEGV